MQSNLGDKLTEIDNSCMKISKQEEAENDKYRILNKFGFNKGTFQSQLFTAKIRYNNITNNTSQSEKVIKKIGKELQTLTQQTTANASSSSLIKTNNKKEPMYPIEEKLSKKTFSKSKRSNQSIQIKSSHNSKDSSSDIKTEKESRNEHMKEIQLKSNMRIQETLSKLSKDSSYGVIENLNEINDEGNTSKTNYIPDAIAIKEIHNEETDERDEYKNELINIFRIPDDNMYNISFRIINDEYNDDYSIHHRPPGDIGNDNEIDNNNHHHHHYSTAYHNRNYSFISAIYKANESLSSLFIRKHSMISLIKQMTNESLFYLLFHSFDMFNIYLVLCKDIRTRILSMLNDKFITVINLFKEQYSSILKVNKISFKSKTYFNNNKAYPIFDLVISSEIITKDTEKCYHLSYEYIDVCNSNNKEIKYLYTWKFDIRNTTKYGLWFTSEIENYNQLFSHYCYTQPITSYSKGDIIQLHLNIFSYNNKINPSKIKFLPLISIPCPKVPYEKKELRQKDVFYDSLRSCEIERIVHLWKDISNLNKKTFIPNIIDLFKDYFDITNIQYDVSQFYYIRYKMKARTIGVLKRNKFFSFDIQIVDHQEKIENETQCLGILNINSFQSRYMIHVGTHVTFYCIEL